MPRRSCRDVRLVPAHPVAVSASPQRRLPDTRHLVSGDETPVPVQQKTLPVSLPSGTVQRRGGLPARSQGLARREVPPVLTSCPRRRSSSLQLHPVLMRPFVTARGRYASLVTRLRDLVGRPCIHYRPSYVLYEPPGQFDYHSPISFRPRPAPLRPPPRLRPCSPTPARRRSPPLLRHWLRASPTQHGVRSLTHRYLSGKPRWQVAGSGYLRQPNRTGFRRTPRSAVGIRKETSRGRTGSSQGRQGSSRSVQQGGLDRTMALLGAGVYNEAGTGRQLKGKAEILPALQAGERRCRRHGHGYQRLASGNKAVLERPGREHRRGPWTARAARSLLRASDRPRPPPGYSSSRVTTSRRAVSTST